MIYLRKTKLRTRRVIVAGVFALLSCGAAGLGAGLWLADDSAEITRLRWRLAKLEQQRLQEVVLDAPIINLVDNSSPALTELVDFQTVTFQAESDHAYLGISCDLDRDPEVRGVPISLVYDGTPASAVGIQAGDTVIAVDDQVTADYEELKSQIRSRPIGAKASITVLRDGRSFERQVSLASWRVYHGE